MAKSRVQKHFGGQSADYTRSGLLSDQGNLDTVVRLADISEKDRVLDVATGTGFLAAAMARTACEVVATDITASMLEQAMISTRERCNSQFALADAEHLPFKSDSFDVVTCRVALHHFPHPFAALSEMARVCRATDRVVIMSIEEQSFRR
jgi:ubiquinone/menaquinone biosynthesis C-methylase UbiE